MATKHQFPIKKLGFFQFCNTPLRQREQEARSIIIYGTIWANLLINVDGRTPTTFSYHRHMNFISLQISPAVKEEDFPQEQRERCCRRQFPQSADVAALLLLLSSGVSPIPDPISRKPLERPASVIVSLLAFFLIFKCCSIRRVWAFLDVSGSRLSEMSMYMHPRKQRKC